jgi:hypothetical protein
MDVFALDGRAMAEYNIGSAHDASKEQGGERSIDGGQERSALP